jgi:hypothetical protein
MSIFDKIREFKMPIVWTAKPALEFCSKLWPMAAKHDWHFGMTGGVMYKGESSKDLDLIFYPHTGTKPTLEGLHAALKEAGMEQVSDFPIGYEGKYVEIWITDDDKRVDIIIENKPCGL